MYKLQPQMAVDVWETGAVTVSPATLIRTFGPPLEADGYKISGCYSFVDTNGQAFVIIDWKSTNLYSDDYPSPDEFWQSHEPEEFTIQSAGIAPDDFVSWLHDCLSRENADEVIASHSEPDSPVSTQTKLYILRTLVGAVGLVVHVWTTWLAFSESGFWSAVLYFALFIYAELYWAYKLLVDSGLNSYSIIAGGWAVAYLVLLVASLLLSKKSATLDE